jgi:four helix bundle protein
MSRDYKKLEVWRKAHNLAVGVYGVTRKFPSTERLGIISQMRRAAVSVPANIVEGADRKGQKEYCHFLYNALSSCNELGYHFYLAKELKFIEEKEYKEMDAYCVQVSKMLQGLISRIQKDLEKPTAKSQ